MNLDSISSWRSDTLWFEVALICGITAIGGIWLGHFEEGTSKWRRVLKLINANVITVLISATLGRVWAFGLLGLILAAVLAIHLWWLPKHGINGWTGEPREKYFELRGWKRS